MSSRYAASSLMARMPAFKAWLTERGAQIVPNTNPWELVRFIAGFETGVIYTNRQGGLSFQGAGEKTLQAFLSGDKAWRAVAPTKRERNPRPKLAAVRRRDGPLCFFCRLEVERPDESLEHLVAVSAGGPAHLSNFYLAHRTCNAEAGHLSAPEKIARHVRAELARLRQQDETTTTMPEGTPCETT